MAANEAPKYIVKEAYMTVWLRIIESISISQLKQQQPRLNPEAEIRKAFESGEVTMDEKLPVADQICNEYQGINFDCFVRRNTYSCADGSIPDGRLTAMSHIGATQFFILLFERASEVRGPRHPVTRLLKLCLLQRGIEVH